MQAGGRSGQRADSNQQSETTERHEGSACALQEDEKQARESNDPRPTLPIIPCTSIDGRGLVERVVLHLQRYFLLIRFGLVV